MPVFLKNALYDFYEILDEIRGSQGSKTDGAEFFRKTIIFGRKSKFSLKWDFLAFAKNLIPRCVFVDVIFSA